MSSNGPKFDPRSPVQPAEPSRLPWIVLVVFLLAAWGYRGAIISALKSALPTAQLGTPAHETVQSSSNAGVTGVFTGDDYPAEALQRNEQGTTVVRIHVSADGHVASCLVDQSSGSTSLDAATCRIISERARWPQRNEASVFLKF